MAEGQGFEPWEAFTSTVFKTVTFGRSVTPPSNATPSVNGFQDHQCLGPLCHPSEQCDAKLKQY
jgi:hypothetical protein